MKEGAPSINVEYRASVSNWKNSEIKKRWFNLQPGENFKAFVNGDAEQVITFERQKDGALIAKFAGEEFFYAGFATHFFNERRQAISLRRKGMDNDSDAQQNSHSAKHLASILCLAKALDDAENDIKRLEEKLANAEAEKRKVEDMIVAAEKALKENQELQRQLQKAKQYAHQMKVQAKNLQVELQRQRPTLNELHDKNVALELEIRRLRVNLAQKDEELALAKSNNSAGMEYTQPYKQKVKLKLTPIKTGKTDPALQSSQFLWKPTNSAKESGTESPNKNATGPKDVSSKSVQISRHSNSGNTKDIFAEIGVKTLPINKKGYIDWGGVPKLVEFIVFLKNQKGWSAQQISDFLSELFNHPVNRNSILGMLSRRGDIIFNDETLRKYQALYANLPAPSRTRTKRAAHIKTKRSDKVNKKKETQPATVRNNAPTSPSKPISRTSRNKSFFEGRVLDAKFNLDLNELNKIMQKILKALHLPDKEEVLSDIKNI